MEARLNKPFHELDFRDQLMVTRYVIENHFEALMPWVPFPAVLGTKRARSLRETIQRHLLRRLMGVEAASWTDSEIRVFVGVDESQARIGVKIRSKAQVELAKFLGMMMTYRDAEGDQWNQERTSILLGIGEMTEPLSDLEVRVNVEIYNGGFVCLGRMIRHKWDRTETGIRRSLIDSIMF